MRKKIVVFATSYFPFVGGAEIAVREVSRRLCESYDFFIITSRQKRELARREIVPEGTIIRVGFGNGFDKWLIPLFGVIAVCRLGVVGDLPRPWRRGSGAELLIWGMDLSQGSFAGYVMKMLFCKIPFVFTIQYGNGDARLEKGRMGAISFAFMHILRAADSVTAISSYLFRMAGIHGFAGIGKIIPNGVDTSVFAFRDAKDNEKNKDQHQRVVITTSRLVHKNGIDTLIRAVAEVKEKYPSIKCYILGDGPERGLLEKLAKELKLEKDIIFLGNIPYEELPFYLGKADVFARPSRSEGMGNSFVEALAVGVPAIGTSVGGIPDIIVDRKTGITCNVDDPHDLSQKILLLLEDKNLATHVCINGRRLVEEKFSWNAITQSYGDMFEKLLNVHKRVLIATPLYSPEIGGPATYSKTLVDGMLNVGVLIRVARFSEVGKLPKIVRHISYAIILIWRSRYADIIYAQDPVSVGFPTAIAARITRKKFTVKIVGDYAWEQGVQRFGVLDLLDEFLQRSYSRPVELLRVIQRFTARRAAVIIVPSQYLKTVVARWGIAEKKINVIANSFEIPCHIISRRDARVMLGLTGRVVISAGRLVPWKGFGTLICAVNKLVKENMPLSLIIIGSGPLEKELRDAIMRSNAGTFIHCIGRVEHDEMLMFLAAADAFVLNTGYEGFSHSLLEAMAMGAPVITTAVGGNPELIVNKKNGFLVEYDNEDQLMEAMGFVLTMPAQERERIAIHARKTAEQFSTTRMLRETAEFFLSL